MIVCLSLRLHPHTVKIQNYKDTLKLYSKRCFYLFQLIKYHNAKDVGCLYTSHEMSLYYVASLLWMCGSPVVSVIRYKQYFHLSGTEGSGTLCGEDVTDGVMSSESTQLPPRKTLPSYPPRSSRASVILPVLNTAFESPAR